VRTKFAMFFTLALVLAAIAVPAQAVCFTDPTGDDDGNGEYTYPTDAVYKRGSFDLTEFCLEGKGGRVDVSVTVNSGLEDPWRMGTGFAVQMAFVFIDTGSDGPHFTEGLPGLNVEFAAPGWDKVIILSPQGFSRVNQEVESKVKADMQGAVVVPTRTKGSGSTIAATVKLADLGEGDPESWGYQVLMQSNEGFPADTDLLTRKVNEFEGQHRFGGGTDYDCDPHVMDLLADAEAQHAMLSYECAADGTATKRATVALVRKGAG